MITSLLLEDVKIKLDKNENTKNIIIGFKFNLNFDLVKKDTINITSNRNKREHKLFEIVCVNARTVDDNIFTIGFIFFKSNLIVRLYNFIILFSITYL